jgi:hypothetical protein
VKLEVLYPTLARLSLGLFLVSFCLHLCSLLDLLRVPEPIFPAMLAPIFPVQLVLILGINGGEFRSRNRQPYRPGRSWSYFFASLKHIPLLWRLFGLMFCYVYCPIIGVLCFRLSKETAFLGLVASAFPLVHFLAFRFVLPKRHLIIESVQSSTAT